MYINISFAKITYSVFIIFFAVSTFIFFIQPYFVNVLMYFDSKNGRLNFCVILYGFVKIVGGYITFSGTDAIVHLSEKKAILIDIIQFEQNMTPTLFSSLEFISFKSSVLAPVTISGFSTLLSVNAIYNTVFPVVMTNKDFISMQGKIDYTLDQSYRFVLSTTFVFNVVSIISIFVKFLRSKL